MTEASQEGLLTELVGKETWTAEDHRRLLDHFFELPEAAEKLRSVLSQLKRKHPDATGAEALKIGVAQFMLCRFAPALESFNKATDNKDRRYFQAMCYRALCRHGKAIEEFDRARSRGWDEDDAEARIIEQQALAGRMEEAETALSAFQRRNGEQGRVLYLRGLVHELSGQTEAAAEAYEKARSGGGHEQTDATFRLAYLYDLYGHEDEAAELYRNCLSAPPVYAHALVNLSVLYEDAGQYDEAAVCLRRVLKCNPNHPRARLFLKDVESAKTMYFDEEQAKRVARRNAVLDIPVTDFELSVRARNCLKKMNIYTLGDLVQTTEAELLAYKNFGETSLKEIKDMLSAKGLSLGQALEEGEDFALLPPEESPGPEADQGVLASPLDQVEFSVRARRALESLGLVTLGDLVNKTEAELLACKNFGQTSLNEVRQKLSEYGLSLRGKG